jgi:hypothetical protein
MRQERRKDMGMMSVKFDLSWKIDEEIVVIISAKLFIEPVEVIH